MPATQTPQPVYSNSCTVLYTGDGSTTDFTFTFDYLGKSTWTTKTDQVRVWTSTTSYDNMVENTTWTQPNSTTVRFTSAPANNALIEIRRDSKLTSARVTYQDGGRITAGQQNLAYLHNLYLNQEQNDKIGDLALKMADVLAGGTVNVLGTPAANSVTTGTIASGAVTFPKIDFSATGSNGQALFKRSGVAAFDAIAAADVSGLATAVKLYRLDEFAVPTGSVSLNSQKITNLADPVSDGDAVNLSYLNDEIDAINSSTADGGRVVTGQFTAGVSFATTTLGWQPDMIEIWPDFGVVSGVRGVSPTQRYLDTGDNPVSYEPIVYQAAHGNTLQYWQMASTGAQAVLGLQRLSTGFKYKLFNVSLGAGFGTMLFNYRATRNSTVS